ncbi:uncharacterized protein LOC133680161 [Populus nigra]|uniref:uncharacterized protein LOC133680161 n=1 Tax=Populus nigra TaxID=3691 RepID=UPI002B2684E7|nr:uncharacterized protein LOC133680161 [Populus nigra]
MMIRQLEDDGDDDDEEEDDEDVNTKKHMLPPKVAKKKKIQSTSTVKQSTTSYGKQKKSATLGTYFMPRTTPGAQKSLQNCWQRKEAVERCDLALAKWMFDACVPFNAVNSVYYQHAIDAVTTMGPGYKGPNLHAIRGYYLAKAVDEVKIYVESYREIWKKTGCTLMADGWTDQKRRTLINFLVYCPKGTVFLKTVDVSDVSKTARLLYQLFREVVLYVGVENIVHMVTDNAANYVAAGRLLMEEFPSILWSPCAAHCINLILQDIGKLQSVCCVVEHASGITKYIYNHCYPLYLMRKFTRGKEILRPAPTRFATNFIALQSILAHKDELRAMVTSREWVSSAYAKDIQGKNFVDSVLDSLFWEECVIIVRMSEPLVRVLRLVDAAFWLNPRFQYDANIMDKHMRTISGLLDVLEKYAHGNLPLQSKITSEMKFFRNAEHDFGRASAINNRTLMPPDEWWMTYGTSAPNLQQLAIRVLSQTCSSSGCERNWIEDDPSILTTEEVESFHQALSTMTIQDTLDDDVINVNEIEDDCDDEVSKEHADDLLGVDKIGSFPSTFDPNFAAIDTEELNVFIQQK